MTRRPLTPIRGPKLAWIVLALLAFDAALWVVLVALANGVADAIRAQL